MKDKTGTGRKKQSAPDDEAFLWISLHSRVIAWLQDLADIGLWGQTPEEVAAALVQAGVVRELRGDGFLRTPPPGAL
ncbi:MAG: hypothetical protein HYS43_00610 [Candidatus Liptonbacteria bacterium]|nr:hypothetical protein [Candidatus Liptonbacteria bacterium]